MIAQLDMPIKQPCGQSCGNAHLHCAGCDAVVPVDEAGRCSLAGVACSREPRCRECAWEHYQEQHAARGIEQ